MDLLFKEQFGRKFACTPTKFIKIYHNNNAYNTNKMEVLKKEEKRFLTLSKL